MTSPRPPRKRRGRQPDAEAIGQLQAVVGCVEKIYSLLIYQPRSRALSLTINDFLQCARFMLGSNRSIARGRIRMNCLVVTRIVSVSLLFTTSSIRAALHL